MQPSNSMPGNATRPLEMVTEAAVLHDQSKALLIKASREAQAQGHTYEQIGKAQGVSKAQAWRRVNGKVSAE
ncbi:hypothetical protein ACIPY0_12395 [Paenarthrobacter nicotinovorans]|uniref:hypothetical protein n=1 Tax=Paenarthrobacter nicotinovorans TaxID=29320 RepID=UPI00381EBC42